MLYNLKTQKIADIWQFFPFCRRRAAGRFLGGVEQSGVENSRLAQRDILFVVL